MRNPFDVALYTRLLGERRALALLGLAAFVTIFILVAIAQGGAWVACFTAMAIVYGVAFFGIASEWFWGRWFAMGIATSGMTMAVLGLITSGWNGALLFWGVVHTAIYLPLLGGDMAERYEKQTAWRERWQLDDAAVVRIKRAVNSTATALPTLIFYTLAPRQDQAVYITLLAVFLLGCAGLVRMRTWGIAALGVSAVGAGVLALSTPCGVSALSPAAGISLPAAAVGMLAATLLAFAVAPFVRPAYRFLRREA